MATLKNLVDETTNIKNELKECHTNLKNNLIEKGVDILPTNSKKMSNLIEKVKSIKAYPSRVNVGDNHSVFFDSTNYSEAGISYVDVVSFSNFVVPGNYRTSINVKTRNSTYAGYVRIEHRRNGEVIASKTGSTKDTDYSYKFVVDFEYIELGDEIYFALNYSYGKNANISCELIL